MIRNATDSVAFLSFMGLGYAVMISIFIYAHYARH
jgi:hypothetical protein